MSFVFEKLILVFKRNLKEIQSSIFLVFLVHLTVLNFLGKQESSIRSDGEGYYDYLPSIFIQHDFIRKDQNMYESPEKYARINELPFYLSNEYHKANKFPVGTALLEFPFFYSALLIEGINKTSISGFEPIFQNSIYASTLFYLFLGLLFLWKILRLYEIKWQTILIAQCLVVFSTSILNYSTFEPSFSHVYSFFAINAFLYYSKLFFKTQSIKFFLVASFLIGFIILIRQINVLVILFLPFIAGSYSSLKSTITSLFNKPLSLIFSIIIVVTLFSIQLFAWYFQTGEFYVYSYQHETFNFLEPEIFNILFSFQKGLFIYTPICFLGLISSLYFIREKSYFAFISWWLFFAFITYVFSSWWCWYYGGSYGLRAYIEYYIIFFIPLSLLLDKSKGIVKTSFLIFSFALIPITLIQTYQYKNYILEWTWMDKQKFWDVFLETDERFRGFVWKKYPNMDTYIPAQTFQLNDITINKGQENQVFYLDYSENQNLINANLALIEFENQFLKHDLTDIYFIIETNEKNVYWEKKNIIHFKEKTFGETHKGKLYFELPKLNLEIGLRLRISIKSALNNNTFKDLSIQFFSPKNLNIELESIINTIKNDENWLNNIKTEAEEKGISLEENILAHAKWVLKEKYK